MCFVMFDVIDRIDCDVIGKILLNLLWNKVLMSVIKLISCFVGF